MAAAEHLFLKAAQSALLEQGFKKRTGQIYTKALTETVLGWLGLNRSIRRDGRLEVNPVIGIRHQPVERLVAQMTGEPFHEYIPPTLSTHLGYLSRENRYTPVLVGSEDQVASSIEQLVRSLLTYGGTFMEQHMDLGVVVDSLRNSKYTVPEQAGYRLPVAFYLTGDPGAAQAYLRAQLSSLGSRSDGAAVLYQEFSGRLSELLSRSESA